MGFIATKPPVKVSIQGKCQHVVNQELLTSVTSVTSGVAVTGSISLGAGSGNLPWLSQVAKCYNKFRFTKLEIWWEPCIAMSVGGSVSMALIYDAADTSVTPDEAALAQCEGNLRLPIWQADKRKIKYDPKLASLPWYFVSTATSTASQNMEIPTTFQYVVSANIASAKVGSFWCSYELLVCNPVAPAINS